MTKLAEQLKQGADQAWESLSEGWRDLSARASGALTRFRPARGVECFLRTRRRLAAVRRLGLHGGGRVRRR